MATEKYNNNKFGIEKILTLPPVTLSSAAANWGRIITTEDIVPIELGAWVTTAVSGGAGTCSFGLRVTGTGGYTLGTITLATTTAAIGSTPITASTAASSLTATAIASGSLLEVYSLLTTTAGVVTPYLKYRSAFI